MKIITEEIFQAMSWLGTLEKANILSFPKRDINPGALTGILEDTNILIVVRDTITLIDEEKSHANTYALSQVANFLSIPHVIHCHEDDEHTFLTAPPFPEHGWYTFPDGTITSEKVREKWKTIGGEV